MFVQKCLGINEKGHLTIGGLDTVELAKEYGTPLYLMDEETIRKVSLIFNRQVNLIDVQHSVL